MIKLKKLLAGVLGAAMVMTSMTVLADTARDDTINTDTSVSLTIHKYRMDNADDATTPGTGESSDMPADGAVPLDGVEFKVYKVADIIQAQDADGNWQIQYNTVSDFTSILGDTIEAGSSPNSNIETKLINIIPTATEVTGPYNNETGIAYFSSDELKGQGLYLVVEGSAPDVVTQKTAPFYVSLPMTDADGEGWLYDVHAYPKNGTTTGSVTLHKYGKKGNAPASGVTGAQFVVQKYDSVTKKWVTCETNDNGEAIGTEGTEGVLMMTDSSITVGGLSQGTYRFVEVAAPDDAYIMDGSAVYEFKMTAAGKVTDENGNELNSGISVTNYKPEVEKKVAQKGIDIYKDEADYSVDDTVPFKVTATIPENVNKLTHYVLVDTMDEGLADPRNYVVKFYRNNAEVTVSGITTTPVTNTSGAAGWKLDLSNDVGKLVDDDGTLLADTVEVTFDATLTADAITGGLGNHNTVGLEYTNKIYPSTDDGNPNKPDDGEPSEETRTITDKVVVYTFGLELAKTFQGVDASETVFAKFDLYREATNTDTDTVALKVGSTTVNVVKVGSYQTDAEGKITINTSGSGDNDKAFSNGTYYFVETETADGYNLLSEPVAVTVQYYYIQTFQTTTTVTKYDANGNIIGEPEVTTTGTDATTYYTDADNEVTATVTTKKVDVVNKKGFTLPTTGGMGSIIFIVGGIALAMAGLLIILASSKKRTAK